MDLSILESQNPWWRGAPMPGGTPRDVVEELVTRLAPAPTRRRAVVLSGLRQVGKSHALRDAAWRLAARAERPTDVMYVELDPRLTPASIERVLKATGFLDARSGRKVLLVDEVGKDPTWQDVVKRLVDLEADGPSVAVSDSRVALLKPSTTGETAMGRRYDILLEPMSFTEVARAAELAVSDPRDADSLGLAVLADTYLRRGGFPAHALSTLSSDEDVWQLLRQDTGLTITLDASRTNRVRDFDAIRRVWAVVARDGSLAPNQSKLASTLGVDRRTIVNLLQVLTDLLLLRRLEVSGGGALTPARHHERLTVADPGLCAAFKSPAELNDPEHLGKLVEVAVHRHLDELARNQQLWLGYAYAKKRELDFLLETPDGQRIAVETKYSGDANPPDAQKLGRIARDLGAAHAVLVSRAPHWKRVAEDPVPVWRFPLWAALHWPGLVMSPETQR